MKYHALFVIFEKAAKFEIVVCCKITGGALRVIGVPGAGKLEVVASLFYLGDMLSVLCGQMLTQ